MIHCGLIPIRRIYNTRTKDHYLRYLLLLFFLTLLQPASAAFRMTMALEEAYLNFLALKVDKASQQISRELITNPDNGIAIYLENYADLVRLLVSEEGDLYTKLSANENTRLEKIGRLEKESPYYLFCQAEIKLHWAFVKLKFGQELGAAWNIRQAYKLLEQNHQKFPDFLPNKKSLGLLHVLIGSVPEKYTWIVNSVGMRGSISEGLLELQAVQESNLVYKMEASLLLSMIHSYILKSSKETLAAFGRICEIYPDNLLAHFVYASVAMKEGESELALRILHRRPAGSEYLPFYLIAYRKAEIYLQKGNYEEALRQYHFFLSHFKGQNFLKDTYYKLFLIHWLQGREPESEKMLAKVLEIGQTVTESDKYAQAFAEAKHFPHKNLMRARLSFDGGYYQQADDVLRPLSENSFSHPKDKAEFYYRKARIFHRTGKTEEAASFYMRTIQLSEQQQYYFGANAALQMGYIRRQQGNTADARSYFEKALSYKKHEYKNSIDNKAKAALDELCED